MLYLQELRKKKKISQNEMAKFLNVTSQAYSRYERGERELGYENLAKLAKFFDVSIDYLLGNTTFFYPDSVQNESLASTEDEKELLALYRSLMPDYKNLALTNLRMWAGATSPANDLKKKA